MSLSPFPPSPLVLVEQALRRLDHGPGGFTINPAELGLPAIPAHPGGLSVLQVRDILARQATPIEVKNRAWAALIARTRHDKPVWTLAALGIALPRLRRVSRVLTQGYRGCPADLDAEILTGFLTALAGARTDRQQRFPALVRAARSAGLAWARQCRLAATTPAPQLTAGTGEATTDPPTGDATGNTAVNVGMGDPGNDTVSAPLSHAGATVGGARSGHPDLVLADAVAAGIITATEAEIIAATRLEQRPLREVAATYRISVNTLWMRRDRAEKRLVTELTRAIAADDTDRATDPTHAHLLATTPLGQRLEQQADQPASTRQAPTPPTPVQPGAPADSRADAPRRHPYRRWPPPPRTWPPPPRTWPPPRPRPGAARARPPAPATPNALPLNTAMLNTAMTNAAPASSRPAPVATHILSGHPLATDDWSGQTPPAGLAATSPILNPAPPTRYAPPPAARPYVLGPRGRRAQPAHTPTPRQECAPIRARATAPTHPPLTHTGGVRSHRSRRYWSPQHSHSQRY